MNREEIKEILYQVILNHLKSKGIEPNDTTRVLMQGPEIWDAMVKSGRLPRALTYDMMMESMFKNMIGEK